MIVEPGDASLDVYKRQLYTSIESKLRDDAPVATNKGGIFKDGANAELDEYRYVVQLSLIHI